MVDNVQAISNGSFLNVDISYISGQAWLMNRLTYQRQAVRAIPSRPVVSIPC